MTPGPDDADSTGPPDRQTLRLLEKHLASDGLVADTTFEPNHSAPRSLRVRLDEDLFPTTVGAVRLDVRWFESGDYTFHYVERRSDGSTWECRWDRHPNEHNARSHFHRPPDASEIEDCSLPSDHPLEVYSIVFEAIEQRLEDAWSSDP